MFKVHSFNKRWLHFLIKSLLVILTFLNNTPLTYYPVIILLWDLDIATSVIGSNTYSVKTVNAWTERNEKEFVMSAEA